MKSNVGWLAYGEGVKDGKLVHVAMHCRLKTDNGAKNRLKMMTEAYDGMTLDWVKAFECGAFESSLWDTEFRSRSKANRYVTYYGDLDSCIRTATF